MKVSDHPAARISMASLALAFALAGCSSGDQKSTESSSSSSSPSAAPTSSAEASSSSEDSTPSAAAGEDYSNLLVAVEDLPTPGQPLIADPPMLNPSGIQGVAQLFHTADNTAMIGDTIAVLPDEAQAAKVLAAAKDGLGTSVTGAPAPSPVGTGGTVAAGTSPDGSKAVTVLLFTDGNRFVTLEFDSAPGDLNPVPPDYVESVGQLQLEALQGG